MHDDILILMFLEKNKIHYMNQFKDAKEGHITED